MKKKYIKPELFFEQFMLNQHMAQECDWNWIGLSSELDTNCSISGSARIGMQDITIFMEHCVQMDGTPEGYCYYTAVNAIGEFGSGG